MEIIYIIIALIIIALLVVALLSCYVKSPPNRAIIITGPGKEPRILKGKAGFKIPFLERADFLDLGVMAININTEEYIATNDFINIQVEAVVQVAVNTDSPNGMQVASRNFLNMKKAEIQDIVNDTLQGNLREVVGTMTLKNICQNKTAFSESVKENAASDMEELGIKIISFNVKNLNDRDGLINDLGIDNREQISKDAAIAKAKARSEVAIQEAEAENAANIERVKADTQIAERRTALAIKQSELKIDQDQKKAEADAAYKIQQEISRKQIEIQTQEAEIARREKEIELQAREAEVTEKRLDAEIKKKAEAEKFAEQQKADAELYRRQKEAEAELFEKEKEAEAIKKQGEAEAEAIRMKGDAEAEALDKKAEAMQKYGQAAILEMIVGVLPDIAKAVAEPISAIDKVTVIGGNSDGVSDMSGNVPVLMAKVMESVKEATGIDINEIVKAQTYDAKVNHNIKIDGISPEKVEIVAGDTAEE